MAVVLVVYALMVLAATAIAFGGATVAAAVWVAVMTATVALLARDIGRSRFLVPDRVPRSWTAD